MAEFVSYSTAVQVSGQAIRSVAEAMSDFLHVASDILKRHGISEPQPDRWYSQQAFLDSLKEVYEVFGTNTLTLIGRQIPDTAFLPRDIDSWEAALHAINVGYHMNHRGGEIGFYKFEQDGKLAGRVVCQCPYPSDFDLGLIMGFANRFRPKGYMPTVRLDQTAPTRKKGAESCTFLVEFEKASQAARLRRSYDEDRLMKEGLIEAYRALENKQKRVEELLHSILPRKIVEQLHERRGEMVVERFSMR